MSTFDLLLFMNMDYQNLKDVMGFYKIRKTFHKNPARLITCGVAGHALVDMRLFNKGRYILVLGRYDFWLSLNCQLNKYLHLLSIISVTR